MVGDPVSPDVLMTVSHAVLPVKWVCGRVRVPACYRQEVNVAFIMINVLNSLRMGLKKKLLDNSIEIVVGSWGEREGLRYRSAPIPYHNEGPVKKNGMNTTRTYGPACAYNPCLYIPCQS